VAFDPQTGLLVPTTDGPRDGIALAVHLDGVWVLGHDGTLTHVEPTSPQV
jgi:hypothetical protein